MALVIVSRTEALNGKMRTECVRNVNGSLVTVKNIIKMIEFREICVSDVERLP